MKDSLVYKNGHLKKPNNDVIPCKFRGTGIECEKSDFRSGFCKFCGWNPLVEMKRIEKAKQQPMKRRPRKSQIFTKGWE